MLRAPDGPVRGGKRMHGGLSRGSPSFMALQKIRTISFCLERSFFQNVPFRSPHHFISQYISKTSADTFQDIPPPFFSFFRSVPPRFRHHQSIGSAPFLCYTGCVPAPGSIPVSPGGTMSALPFLHDRQFSPRLSLVCLVCLLLLPACPAPGSGLDGTAHNHHAQIRAGDA